MKFDRFDVAGGKWWFTIHWSQWNYVQPFNWLSKEDRYWGYHEDWYDGPWKSFGFWFFNIAWDFS